MLPNPYIGPRSFQTGEPLYGRDREARELLGLLVAERIVLLYSPSGAGKTSLIQAALIPRLVERDFFVRPPIRVSIDAGEGENRYLRSTLLALEEGRPAGEQLPLDELASLSLDAYLSLRAPPEGADDEVLIFDQFEEVLTADPTDVAVKRAFFAQLGEALYRRDRWALFAMREDYVAGLDPYVLPIPTRLNSTFRLNLLGLDAAREVMRRPAQGAGVDFGDEAAARLADDLSRVLVQRPDGLVEEQRGSSVEPVQLQVVCHRLWASLPAGSAQIGLAEVTALGDVNRALADYYAAGVARATAGGTSERAIRAWFDRQLITPQGMRGTVLQGGARGEELSGAVVAALIDAYLVRGERRRGATWLELAHDRLIAPVRESNRAWFAANLTLLQRQADLWAQQGRPASLLLRDEALAEAEAGAAARPGELTADEAELLRLSQEARDARERERRQARQIRALLIGAAALLAAVAVAVGIAYWNQQRAEAEARLARSRELAAAAIGSLGSDPVRSVLLAQAAADATGRAGEPPSVEARDALYQATQSSRARRIIIANPSATERRGLQSVAYSPDGALLAAAGNDGALRIWDAATGAERSRLAVGDARLGGLAYSPDGAQLAATADNAVLIWDTATGAQLLALEGHADEVLNLAFSPDGVLLATASRDGTARLWDVDTGAGLGVLAGHEGEVTTVAFSADGALVATGGEDGSARLWEVASGEEALVLDVGDQLLAVAVSPAEPVLATAGADGIVRLWDAEGGALLDVLRGHGSSVQALAFSADGAALASTGFDGAARVWEVAAGRTLLTLAGHADVVTGAAFSPDGRSLATSSLDGTLRVWSLALAPPGGAFFVAYGPDGALLATAGERGADVWEAATGAPRYTIPADTAAGGVAFSPDGALLAVADYSGLVQLADAASGTVLATLEDTPDGVNRLAFSPDGALLATAGGDGLVRVWDIAARTTVQALELGDEAEQVFSLAFAPGGSLLAAGDEGGELAVWDLASGERRLTLAITAEQPVNSLAYSPDGRLLVAADEEGAAWVWDAASGAVVRRLAARAPVLDLAFSPDGAVLATAGRDRAVTLWATATWREQQRLPHPADVNSVAFRDDGAWLATADDDGLARVLPLGLDDLLALAAERAVRTPTPAECEAYGLVAGCGG